MDSSAEEGAPRPSKGLESKSLFDFRTDSEQIFTVTKYLYQTIKQYLSSLGKKTFSVVRLQFFLCSDSGFKDGGHAHYLEVS